MIPIIKDIIDSAVIIASLAATSKAEVLDEVLDRAVDDGRLTKRQIATIRKGLLERESRGSTGIGNGVAVPHAKVKGMSESCLVLARSIPGVAYDAVDGRDVHIVFVILAPEDAAEQHLAILRWISGLARSADFRRFVMNLEHDSEIRDLLHEMSPPQ